MWLKGIDDEILKIFEWIAGEERMNQVKEEIPESPRKEQFNWATREMKIFKSNSGFQSPNSAFISPSIKGLIKASVLRQL